MLQKGPGVAPPRGAVRLSRGAQACGILECHKWLSAQQKVKSSFEQGASLRGRAKHPPPLKQQREGGRHGFDSRRAGKEPPKYALMEPGLGLPASQYGIVPRA